MQRFLGYQIKMNWTELGPVQYPYVLCLGKYYVPRQTEDLTGLPLALSLPLFQAVQGPLTVPLCSLFGKVLCTNANRGLDRTSISTVTTAGTGCPRALDSTLTFSVWESIFKEEYQGKQRTWQDFHQHCHYRWYRPSKGPWQYPYVLCLGNYYIPTQTEDLTGLPLALSLPLVQAIQVVLGVLYYR